MYKSERLVDLVNKHGGKQADAYRAIGITRQAWEAILKGKSSPSLINIEKIADYYHVSVDYLLGREFGNINNGTQVHNNVVSGDLIVNEINHLKELLAQKDAQLAEKERTINILLNHVQRKGD